MNWRVQLGLGEPASLRCSLIFLRWSIFELE